MPPYAPGTSAALNNALSGYNSDLSNYQTLAGQQATALNAFTGQQQNTIAGAYGTAMGQTGLQGYQDAVNKIQGQLTNSQNSSAAIPTQTIAAARGGYANNDQVNTQENTSNIPYAQQISQLSANLVPAENAESTAATNTANIAGQIVSGAQLAEQGFSQGQQEQLAALQAKVDQGAALTSSEYSTYAALNAAQIAASATTGAAGITATGGLNAAAIQLGYPSYAALQTALGSSSGGAVQGPPVPGSPAANAALNNSASQYFSTGNNQASGGNPSYLTQGGNSNPLGISTNSSGQTVDSQGNILDQYGNVIGHT